MELTVPCVLYALVYFGSDVGYDVFFCRRVLLDF